MDPLSLTASIITVVQLAQQTAKGINQCRKARKLPAVFAELLAEVSDLRDTLQECELGATAHQQQIFAAYDAQSRQFVAARSVQHYHHHCRQKHSRVLEQATRAKAKLQELETVIAPGTAPVGVRSAAEIRAFWSCAVSGPGRASRFRDELRDIRLGLSASLQVFSATILSKLDTTVDTVATSQERIIAGQLELLHVVHSLARQQNKYESNTPPPYPEISEPSSIECGGKAGQCATKVKSRSKMTRRIPSLDASRSSDAPPCACYGVANVDRLGKYCTPWCSCSCHKATTLHSPPIMHNIFGSLSVVYSGLPYVSAACSEKTCKRKIVPRVTTSYRFPQALTQRCIVTSMSLSKLAGPEMRVKAPRVVNWSSPVWGCATRGDVHGVETLFRNGLASPWDMNPIGGTLLHYAADHWSPELCKLLLDAGVDPLLEDEFKNNAVTIAWDNVLSGEKSDNDACIVADLFKDTDHLSSRCFTVIHKIVLGLVSKDLDYELQCSTADIDKKDARGRTPLSWAAARGDETATDILLRHGADTTITDHCGHSSLHLVRNVQCAKLLLDAGADLHKRNDKGQHPLAYACQHTKDFDLVRFLIDEGSDVNAQDYQLQTALHSSLGEAVHLPHVDLLLDAGASINIANNSRDTPLRFAIIHNLSSLLRRMLSLDADFSSVNVYGQTSAHAIACTADLEILAILTEATPLTLIPDTSSQDIQGKTSLDLFEDRLRFMNASDGKLLKESFERLVKALAPKQNTEDPVSTSGKICLPNDGIKAPIISVRSIHIDEGEETFHDACESIVVEAYS